MSDSTKDEELVDPPDNQGGGGKAGADSPEDEAVAVDPPSNDGGN